MKISIIYQIVFIFFALINFIIARPISYVGGWTLITTNNYHRNSLLTHYTPSFKYSLGHNIEYWNKNEYWLNMLNLNYLLKRINKKNSQTNFYLKSGFGFLKSDLKVNNTKKEYVSSLKFSSDWETRKEFLAYNCEFIRSETIKDTLYQSARIGFAPYIANYGAIHSWVMYEISYMSDKSDKYTSTGILRFFKSTNLLEIGIDDSKNLLVNYIKRF